jgi:hypothetical protein
MHLVKPIDPIELIVAISALAGRRAEASIGRADAGEPRGEPDE